ncbi:MAG: UDP-N-acetylmuramate dehydrogenase [Thermosipho sp. (in: thermotogales)]|nr:UDP-N-acetylmuramate dehydrogenase [Thermosipho sp. (in: thermotogales)]MDN5324649.1 UDP-N-acetylmuramate dehydrogenase [Thermosipho sp. (in: thermotogales)]
MFLEKIFEKLLEIGNDVYLNEKMEYHTSFRIGGPVSLFVVPNSINAFIETYKFLSGKIQVKVVGKCTNILPKDEKMEIAVISTERLNNIDFQEDRIICESGVLLKKLCIEAMDKSLSGFEKAYGIPGSVGGAIYMNAGAYGWETAENLEYVVAFDGNKLIKLGVNELDLSYRSSIFKKREDLIILKASFRALKGEKEKIRDEMLDIIKKRYQKQPLEFPSAGSVFKRPKPDFYVGTAIEKLGFKGFTIGGAQVSKKHAGFIINLGDAKSKDVKEIIEIIKNKVKKEFNVDLETEIEIW